MLPAFAAKCLQQCTHNQHLQQTPALSSKPTGWCCCWTMGQTDGWTERQTPDSYTDPAPHTMRAVSTTEQQSTNQKQQSLWCYFSCHSDTIIQLPQWMVTLSHLTLYSILRCMRCCISSRRIINCSTLYTACSGYFCDRNEITPVSLFSCLIK